MAEIKLNELSKSLSSSMSVSEERSSSFVNSLAGSIKERLESYKGSSIMLIVPERDFFTKTLEYYFESAGWEIEVFTKVVDALVKIETGKAYLVILDCMFEDYQKFCYALKMRRETTNVP